VDWEQPPGWVKVALLLAAGVMVAALWWVALLRWPWA
jgi:hypothetical protein